MYRKNEDSAELVCMVCHRTCVVIVKHLDAVSAHPRWFERLLRHVLKAIGSASLAVHVHGKYTSDARFTRPVDGVTALKVGDRVIKVQDRLAVCSKACSMTAIARKQRGDPSFFEWSFDPTKEDPWETPRAGWGNE